MRGTALSVGQFAELSAAVLKALPRDMTPADALAWANNGERLRHALASALCPLATPMPSCEFERKHGHIILTFAGLDLTGAQEIERAASNRYNMSEWFKQCLLSTADDSYDAKHRLVAGEVYRVALMPGAEIKKQSERTTANLRDRGMNFYGYGEPLAGMIPRTREVMTDEQMEKAGVWYVAALHRPINDADGDPFVLGAGRGGDGRRLGTHYDGPDRQWDGRGLFAFPVPAQVSA